MRQLIKNNALPARSQGFTLIEIMITIAIVAILLAVGIPQYNSVVLKGHRTDAKTALLDLAQREEKYYSQSNAYTNDMSKLYSGASGTSLSTQSGSVSYYTLTVPTVTAAATSSAAYFQAQATPSGTQTNDPCSTLTIDSTGTTGATGGTQTTGCW